MSGDVPSSVGYFNHLIIYDLATFSCDISFGYWNKIEKQQEIIDKQNKTIEQCSYEIKRLKLVEQNFEEEKEYLYECYKDIELKTERSGK